MTLFTLLTSVFLIWLFLFTPWSRARAAIRAAVVQRVAISVKGGFTPDIVIARVGVPVQLTFTRQESVACSERVMVPDFGRSAYLPTGEPVELEFTPRRPGKYGFQCHRGELRGDLHVVSDRTFTRLKLYAYVADTFSKRNGNVTNNIPSLLAEPALPSRDEEEIVARLLQVVAEASVRAAPEEVVNFYVSLKSKPLAILLGPADSGKVALVQSLAQVLIGDDPFRYQPMVGHARWASGSENVTLFTEAQTRFNDDKLLALIEEALRPENIASRVFVACLTHISPAELIDFFAEVALQLRHGELTLLPSIHLTEPIPFPPNMFLIGTMDAVRWKWSHTDLLSKATIVRWPDVGVEPTARATGATGVPVPGGELEFLRSCIRSERKARQRLEHLPGWHPHTLDPLHQVAGLLEEYGVDLPCSVIGEAVIYLANAWTKGNNGLFTSANDRNLAIALDFAIAQTLLPRGLKELRRSTAMQRQLHEVLDGRFPRSTAFLQSLD
jgi:hypothetical protein